MKNIFKNTKLFLALFLATTIVFTSCSSDNESDTGSEELSEIVMQDFKEDIQNLTVPTGLSNSSNQYAQQANAQFQSLKNLSSSFTSLFTIPPGVTATSRKSSIKTGSKSTMLNSQTYTWSDNDGTTVNYTITEQSDRYTFSYSIESAQITGKLMDGYQLKDGSYAEVKLYYLDTVISTIKWWVNSDNVRMELLSDGIKYILESNLVDNSGNLKLYYDNELTTTYIWNGSGSGSYTNHLTGDTFAW